MIYNNLKLKSNNTFGCKYTIKAKGDKYILLPSYDKKFYKEEELAEFTKKEIDGCLKHNLWSLLTKPYIWI